MSKESAELWSTPKNDHSYRQTKPCPADGVTRGRTLGSDVTAHENGVELWPTIRAGAPGSRPNQKGGKILAEEAMKHADAELWSTLRASDGEKGGPGQQFGQGETLPLPAQAARTGENST